jgi:zinc protease
LNEVRRNVREIDRKQSHVVLSYLSVQVDDPDRYPLTVLENILSGQGGRLFYELRDRRSLAYSVSAFFTKGLAPGMFGGYIGTDPSNDQAALDGLLAEFSRVRDEPVKQSELERSQRYLIGARAIGLQTNGAKAEEMALNELYELGFRAGDEYAEKIAEVDVEDVQRVARQYLDPARRGEVIVGPNAGAKTARTN